MTAKATVKKTTKKQAAQSEVVNHAIFNAKQTAADVTTRVQERQSKALAKSQRENKVNNTLITATIHVRQRITKTAITEIALSVPAQHISKVSCQQIAAYIERDLLIDSLSYKHESSSTTRIRNHVREAMKKLCIVDANDVIHFQESFLKIAKDPQHIDRVNKLINEIKTTK